MSGPRSRDPYFSENLVRPGIESGISVNVSNIVDASVFRDRKLSQHTYLDPDVEGIVFLRNCSSNAA
jgi:hypothetical protein